MCDEFFKVSAKKKTLSQALVEGEGGGGCHSRGHVSEARGSERNPQIQEAQKMTPADVGLTMRELQIFI